MNAHRHVSHILGACVLVALATTAAACGGSSTPSSSHSPKTTAPANAAATITSNWQAFFSPKTGTTQRVHLLQDGSQFATIIKEQSTSSLAQGASAKVTKVTVNSPTQATVKYNVLLGGRPALSNQTGTAVYQDGTWKVGVSSFCSLLILENAGKTTGLPAVCSS